MGLLESPSEGERRRPLDDAFERNEILVLWIVL